MSKNYKPKPVVEVEPLDDLTVDVADVVEVVEETPVVQPPAASTSPIVLDGDTYASIGKRLAPEGVSGFEMAKRLHALNGGKPLVAGDKVRI